MAYYPLLKNLPPSFDVLVPFIQFSKELEKELALSNKAIFFKSEKIFIVAPLLESPIWAQDWWPESKALFIESKSQVLKFLKMMPVLGHYYDSFQSKFGKSLVQELRNLEKKRIKSDSTFDFKFFIWTAFEDCLIYCESPFRRFPLGWHEFNEDKTFPPNRAYLKLWELFTVHHVKPESEDTVMDVGASPGGWSWVLSRYFKKVYSVDKAVLDPKINAIQNIQYISGDAFKVNSHQFQDCNWIFSDIICTPQRSYDLILDWTENSTIRNFVCTLKFKGDCNFDIIDKCLSLKGSKIIHLYQNKNEVTWFRQTHDK